MDKEIALKWADYLEQNPELQTRGQLAKGDKRCCLGALCDLYMEDTGKGEWYGPTHESATLTFLETDSEGTERYCLPAEVLYWSGMTTPLAEVNHPDAPFRSLSGWNDAGEGTWTGIARWIRENHAAL